MKWAQTFDLVEQGTVPESLEKIPEPLDDAPTADSLELPEYMADYGPLISVVIPTYGDDHFIPDALSTVANQTYRNLEVILVDASDVDWLEALAEDREWIRYLGRHPSGISHARNEAIEQANGTYVALLDADDLWHPTKLDRQLTAMRENSSVCYSGLFQLNLGVKRQEKIALRDMMLRDPESAWIDRVHNRIYAMPSTLLLRRERIPPRPFAEEMEMLEDFVLDVELFYADPPTHIEEQLVIYRNREGSISNQSEEAVHRWHFHAIEVLRDRLPSDAGPQLRSALSVIERDYGKWLDRQGKQTEARQYFIRGLLNQGKFQLHRENYQRAKTLFMKAVSAAAEEDLQRVHTAVAIACLRTDLKDMGQEHLKKAVEMNSQRKQ